MELPFKIQHHLLAHIDFSAFVVLDIMFLDNGKSMVFLMPRGGRDCYYNIQIGNESKYFGNFDNMIEFALYHKFITKAYANTLIKRHTKYMEELNND